MMMGSQSRLLSGAVLITAGLYQLSPLKNICLAHAARPRRFFRAIGALAPWVRSASAQCTAGIVSVAAGC